MTTPEHLPWTTAATSFVPADPPPRFALGTGVNMRVNDPLCEEGMAQIVHDMKTPLATIALESTLFDCQLAIGDVARTNRAARRISDNVMFLDRLINDLLDATAISAGRFRLLRQETELHALIDLVVDRVSSRDSDRVFVNASGRVLVMIDDLRVERVLANLLDNALKYTSRTTPVIIQMTAAASEVCVTVTDAGPGISADELPRIFDPYRRAESSRGRTGSGLGLYISRKIVEAHGGQMSVESVRGVGARFRFTLPAIP